MQFFCADILDYPAESWVVRAGLKLEGGEPISGLGPPELYSYTFFCSASQMLALDAWNGGVVAPVLLYERWSTITSVFVGSIRAAGVLCHTPDFTNPYMENAYMDMLLWACLSVTSAMVMSVSVYF